MYKLDLKSEIKPLGLFEVAMPRPNMKSKRPKLKPMIRLQIYGVRLNVAKHETQTWHAYIQPETINLTSNQRANPKANRPRI